MLRLFSTLALGIALGYCLYVVRLEGRSVASHVGDIWRSKVVQQKVKLVGRELPKAIKGRLASEPDVAEPVRSGDADDDRRHLDRLVERATHGLGSARHERAAKAPAKRTGAAARPPPKAPAPAL